MNNENTTNLIITNNDNINNNNDKKILNTVNKLNKHIIETNHEYDLLYERMNKKRKYNNIK
jgi:hypothetical protein